MLATQSNVNLCKLLLTLAILGYPTPHIVGWGDSDKDKKLLGGGSHFVKSVRTLEYLNDPERRAQPGFDDDLMLIIDAYDIWFQLPFETLIRRYANIIKEENERVAHRMGHAYVAEEIKSEIVFGGGKHCAPNRIHTLACYPIPESPLPFDIHGINTDTPAGRNEFSSFRTRYLNAGVIMGPVGRMRPFMARAVDKLHQCIDRKGAWYSDANGFTSNCYHGSDQSILVEMFGEQEFHREIMRRHYRSHLDDLLDYFIPNRPGSRPPRTHDGALPIEDYLNPVFDHEEGNQTYTPGKPNEFGMAIDYWSLISHQTSNAELDHRYIKHNQPLEPQVGEPGMFDCQIKAPMPTDLADSDVFDMLPGHNWSTIPLYTEVCVGVTPVMIHHNNMDKSYRETQWPYTWWHGHARRLLEERRKQGLPLLTKGVNTDKGKVLKWEGLCPREVESELFRDVDGPALPPKTVEHVYGAGNGPKKEPETPHKPPPKKPGKGSPEKSQKNPPKEPPKDPAQPPPKEAPGEHAKEPVKEPLEQPPKQEAQGDHPQDPPRKPPSVLSKTSLTIHKETPQSSTAVVEQVSTWVEPPEAKATKMLEGEGKPI